MSIHEEIKKLVSNHDPLFLINILLPTYSFILFSARNL